MMTLAEIQAAAINPDVAREAHAQAQKRLEDALATKASHEQKAFALLAAFITLAVTMFTVFSVLAEMESNVDLAPPFLLAGAMFTIGAMLSGCALLPQTYGCAGSDPSAWLRHGIIDGGPNALPANLAYETFFQKARIDASEKANFRKALLTYIGLGLGIGAPLIVCARLWLSR